ANVGSNQGRDAVVADAKVARADLARGGGVDAVALENDQRAVHLSQGGDWATLLIDHDGEVLVEPGRRLASRPLLRVVDGVGLDGAAGPEQPRLAAGHDIARGRGHVLELAGVLV